MGFRVSSAVKLGISCLVTTLRKHCSYLGAAFLFCIQVISAMSTKQVFVRQWGNGWRTNRYLCDRPVLREEKTEEKNSGSNFNNVGDFKDYLLLLNAYRKSVLKMLWKIITGEHTTNTKGLKDPESNLLNEGTGKEGRCWSATYGNMGQLALHNNLWHDETKKALFTQILKNKGML